MNCVSTSGRNKNVNFVIPRSQWLLCNICTLEKL